MKKVPVKLLPVRFPVYRAIFQLNRSFEECIENLHHVMRSRIFNADHLFTYLLIVKEVRALANYELAKVINDREFKNSAYYERLRHKVLKDLEGRSTAAIPDNREKFFANQKRTSRRSKNKQKKKVRP